MDIKKLTIELTKEKEKLEYYTQVNLESFITNKEIVSETKITLFKTADILNSILHQIALKRVGRLPKSSSECVNFLIKNNYLSRKLGGSFKKLFRFLFFNYDVSAVEDEKEIYDVAKKTAEDLNKFIKEKL